ncbi:hypothetical protein [Brevibacillus sp. MER 51]|uniref:hypothetical protein n=1 Tax=Brevibacillus sp. MER 51 TaxID=2939560 RepID=UPI0033407D23
MEAITQIINEILSEYQAETWEELAVLLRPYFRWEYENATYLTEQELFEMIRKEKKRIVNSAPIDYKMAIELSQLNKREKMKSSTPKRECC